MKKKLDVLFIIFLLIVIVGGIWLNKVTIQNVRLRSENEQLNAVLEGQHNALKDLENVYFQSLLPQGQMEEAKGKLCLMWFVVNNEDAENEILEKVITMLGESSLEKVCLHFSTEPSERIKLLIAEFPWSVKIDSKVISKAIFYVDSNGKIEKYLDITPYSLRLLERYLKIFREKTEYHY